AHRRVLLELGEQRVQRLGVEGERLHRPLGALRAIEVGCDREIGILVLEIDRQLEFLRDVERLELEPALGGPQRALEIAEVRERESQVVVRLRVRRTRLNRAAERIARVLELLELGQYETDA